MSTELDRNRDFGEVRGMPGVFFAQDDKFFNALGALVVLVKGEGKERYAPVGESEPEVEKEEKFVEFDMDSIASLGDFDLFHTALEEADLKPAKKALKAFATDVVGMEKLNTNKGLGKLIDEVRAEYKAVLELDIE